MIDTTTIKDPNTRRWTLSEYYAMAELGLFEGQRVELVNGEIIVMSPQNYRHNFAFDQIAEILKEGFGPGYWIRTQVELHLPNHSAPEPDVAVVKGSRHDYENHPKTALLVVEVAGTTLHYDRTRKAALYASGGIQEYWIVNLFKRQIEVHRDPRAGAKGIWKYDSVKVLKESSVVSPLAKPKVKIAVADLLPPKK